MYMLFDTLELQKPIQVRRVISEKTAARVRSMLREVVEIGTGKRVNSQKLSGIAFGGKTGTAEKYNKELRRYDHTRQVASFIGLAPAENPRYVCMVLMDDPKGQTSGGATSGPIFRKIMEGIYYGPSISPLPYNLANVSVHENCNVEFVGLPRTEAKNQAESRKCPVTFEGEGSTVIASEYDFENSGRKLRLGTLNVQKMPNLAGLTLRDALEQIGELSGSIEYEGVGRVKKQYPAPDAVIKRGEKFKLILSEKG